MPEFWLVLAAPWEFEFMVRALVGGVLMAVGCGVVGAHVVARGLAFIGDAMAHAIFPGVVLAYLLGGGFFLGALAAGVATALLIAAVQRSTPVNEQAAIGIVFAGAFAFGIVLLSTVRSYSVDLARFLFGNVLAIRWQDLAVVAALTVVALAALAWRHRQLIFVGFDPDGAQAAGLPVGRLNALLLVVLSVILVASLQTVGNILVISMLITPAATATLVVRRMPSIMAASAGFGVLAAVVGLYVSFYANTPAGATIVLVSCALFGVVAAARAVRRRSGR